MPVPDNTQDKEENNTKEQQNETTTENVVVKSVCTLSLDDIFVALHEKAITQIKNCRIQNSAINKDNTFNGAGAHVIAALPEKGEKIDKETALLGIQTYVQWFNGPEVAKNVTSDVIWPLVSNDETEDITPNKDNKQDNDKNKTKNENLKINISTFLKYLTEETETEDKNDQNQDPGKQTEHAKGYYITYAVEIQGQKGKPLSDALKTFGKGLLKGLGIQSFDWRTGAKGEVVTIGDVLDSLDIVFGKINPDELKTRFDKNVKSKLPQSNGYNTTYFDKNTLLLHLKKRLETSDKNKIQGADYSFCIKIPKNDKSEKLVNKTMIADMLTKSIQGLFKKFKNKVKSSDVILVNNYSDNKKVEDNKIATTDTTKESLYNKSIQNLLLEADEIKTLTTEEKVKLLKPLIESELKTALKDKFKEFILDRHQAVSKILKSSGIEESKNSEAFSELKLHDYAFLVKTIEGGPTKQATNDSLKVVNSYLNLLFEDTNEDNTEYSDTQKKIITAIKKALILFQKTHNVLPHGTNIENPVVVQCNSNDVEVVENINKIYDITKLIFENHELCEDIKNILFDSYESNDELLLLEKENIFYTKCINKLKEISVERLKEYLDQFKEEFKKVMDSMTQNKDPKTKKQVIKLPKELDSKTENRETYIQMLQKNYMKGNSQQPFIKSVTSKWTNAKDTNDVIDAFNKYVCKGGTVDNKDSTVPECYAAFKALETIPLDEKDKSDDEKIEITFMDIEKPEELENPEEPTDKDKKKYKPIGEPLSLIPGEEVEIPKVDDKGEWKFIEFQPDPQDMDVSGETYAIYENPDEGKIEITFMDIEKPEELENPEEPTDKDKTKYEQIDEPTKIMPGEDVEIPKVEDKGKWKFVEFKPNPKDMEESGETYAIYKDTPITKIQFIEDKNGTEVNLDNPIVFDDSENIDEKQIVYPDEEELTNKYKKENLVFSEFDPPREELIKNLKPETTNNVYIRYVERELVKFTVEFKDVNPDDPENESEWTTINKPLELDSTKLNDIKYPKPPQHNGYKFEKWDKTEEELLNEINEYIDSDEEKTEPKVFIVKTQYIHIKHLMYWVCGDTNGILDKTITIIPKAPKKDLTDPTNEKNRELVDPIGEPIIYKPGGDLKLPEPSQLPMFKGFEFEKWDPDEEAIKSLFKNPKNQEKPIITVARYKAKENTSELKTNNGQYMFYIIPMKNLKLSGSLENTDTDDENSAAGKNTK